MIPIGFCLPKECSKSELFSELIDSLNYQVNEIIDKAKEKIDFDEIYYKIPDGDTKATT